SCSSPTSSTVDTSNMAFVLKRPFAVSAGLKQITRPSSAIRLFHSSPLKSNAFFSYKPGTQVSSNLLKSRPAFQNAFKRTYMQPGSQAYQAPTGNLTQKLLYGAALVGGTIVVTNMVFNRETREDGGMPPFEREYLNQTFLHTGLGVGIIAVAARALHT